jgi:hypothetical protein
MSGTKKQTDGGALSPNQFARRLRVSIHCVLALIRTGELRALNVALKGVKRPRWKITPEALAEFEAARSSKAEPPPTRKRKPRKDPDFVEYV